MEQKYCDELARLRLERAIARYRVALMLMRYRLQRFRRAYSGTVIHVSLLTIPLFPTLLQRYGYSCGYSKKATCGNPLLSYIC